MSDEKFDDVLIHHGVKGMKWGVRRSQAALDRAAGRTSSSDYREASRLKKKPVNSLSNKELRALNERMNLEQNYNRLNPSKVARGKNVAKGVLAAATTAVTVYNLVKSPAGKAAIETGKKVVQSTQIAIRARRAFG